MPMHWVKDKWTFPDSLKLWNLGIWGRSLKNNIL